MAILRPFRALRPLPEKCAEVASVPYDVVSTAEAQAMAGDNPLCFLRVSRPELEMPDGTDIHSDAVYERAAENFSKLREAAPLIVEETPSFYLYRLKMGNHEQPGIVACCSVDEYDNDVILKHERTRQDKEDDRTRHILSLRAQTGPVFLTYRPNHSINELVNAMRHEEPVFDYTAPDGIEHRVWRIPENLNATLIEAFREVHKLYIADGHHRAKSASRAREELRAANPDHTGEEEYNFFQCVLFPADQVHILPYNRVVTDLGGYTPENFLTAITEEFEVAENADPRPAGKSHISLYLNGRWYGLTIRPEVTKGLKVTDRLDVSILQDRLLSPILGIKDVRTDKRISFVGGVRGTRELERLVDSGEFAAAFSMHPVTVDELMDISDAGEIMPPKSTWFEPKLADGLLSHLI